MVRTQIQLTNDQSVRLKHLAATSGRSMAELVREGVDTILRGAAGASRRERMLDAARVFGTSASISSDTSSRHDAHFADAVAATDGR